MANPHNTDSRLDSKGLTRRRLMLALPASASAFAMPSLAGAMPEADPILPLYRQWLQAREEWCRYADLPDNGNWDMPESKAAEELEDAAFWAMIEMTPTSMAGIAALIHVLWVLDGPNGAIGSEDYLEEVNDPNCKLMRAIWRAASGEDAFPLNPKMEPMT